MRVGVRVLVGVGVRRGGSFGQHHWLGPEGGGLQLHPHARRHRGLEGAHGVAVGAGAAPHAGGVAGAGAAVPAVPMVDHHAVQRAERLSGAPRWRRLVLHLLQGVQHHVRCVLHRALPLQLPQLVQGRVHGLLNVLQGGEDEREMRGWDGWMCYTPVLMVLHFLKGVIASFFH